MTTTKIKKTVRDTVAGKSISAYIILKDCELVAKVHVHSSYGNTGTVLRVDVWGKTDILWQSTGSNTELEEQLHGCVIEGVKIYGLGKSDSASQSLVNQYKAGDLSLEQFQEQ